MVISKILFAAKKCGAKNLKKIFENSVSSFRSNRGFQEISIYQNEKDEITSFTIYEDQESANSAISKLFLLFQAVESKLKSLPKRAFISLKEFENFSDGELVFHYKV